MKKEISITEEQARLMHNSGIESLKSIAESNFPDLFHKEKTWEDFGKVKGFYINDFCDILLCSLSTSNNTNKNTYLTKERAEKALALCELMNWRDKANGEPIEDWCDWSDSSQRKYCIVPIRNTYSSGLYYNDRYDLAFKTEQILHQFLKDHKSLIDFCYNIKPKKQ